MHSLRRLMCDRPALAALAIALALMMRIALPAGTMLAPRAMVLTVTICADATQGPSSREVVVPLGEPTSEQGKAHPKDGAPCPFSALSQALLGADALLLAAALAFVIAAGVGTAPALRLSTIARLRPPLRGPPVLA